MSDTATKIKTAREKAGLTQAQAGEVSGYSKSAIEKFENGRRTPPARAIAPLIASLKAAKAAK